MKVRKDRFFWKANTGREAYASIFAVEPTYVIKWGFNREHACKRAKRYVESCDLEAKQRQERRDREKPGHNSWEDC